MQEKKTPTFYSQSLGQPINELIVNLITGSIQDVGYWLSFSISLASIIPAWKPVQEEHLYYKMILSVCMYVCMYVCK